MANRREKIKEIIWHLAANFLQENSNGSSLLTVTNVGLTDDEKRATIFFTVFPDNFEKTALELAKRKRSEFRKLVMEKSKLGRVPMLDFEIDEGEKNRQRVDNLLNQG